MSSSQIFAELEMMAVACDELDVRARTSGELPYADTELMLEFMAARRRLLRELDVAGLLDPLAAGHLDEYPTLRSFNDASRALRTHVESASRNERQLPSQTVLDADVSLDYFRTGAFVPSGLERSEFLAGCEYELTHSHPSIPAGRRFARVAGAMRMLWFRTELKPTPILYAVEDA